MNNFRRFALGCTCAGFAVSLIGCQVVPDVPSALEVKGKPALIVRATGDQIYSWQASTSTWKFKVPEATFAGGGITGKHYAGPTWEAQDGSKVMGQKIAEAPDHNHDAIPLLLLGATDHAGNGVLSDVTFIQRLDTSGGKAPAASGKTDGEETRVHYTATYVFYGTGASATSEPSGMK